jgi:hypothetical protein
MADPLDPTTAEALRIVVSASVGAVAGGLVAEWRARASEARTEKRTLAAEQRSEERDKARLARDDLIRAIDDTLADFLAQQEWLIGWAVGDQARMAAAGEGRAYHPMAQVYLIGDEDLILQVMALSDEIAGRPSGAGFSTEDATRMGAQRGHVTARLDAQRARVTTGQEPLWPSTAFVRDIVKRTGDKYGIPEEYRPKVKDD